VRHPLDGRVRDLRGGRVDRRPALRRVRRGETSRVVDYVAPPLLLSRESTDNDLNWSLATYVTPEVIGEAFKLPGRMIAQGPCV